MYRPNFCCNCGSSIIRLKWHAWTSRSFCDSCSKTLLVARVRAAILMVLVLFALGFFIGRFRRSAPPPLVIERRAESASSGESKASGPAQAVDLNSQVVYMCGARTRKGTPCSRRVHGPVRCWQHKGMRPMLPQEKLLMKDQ
jgi:hypothetical protein